MEKIVDFRPFESRDLDFIHKCKTDEKLNSMVVGNWHPFTLEQSKAWLDGCIRADNPTMKFWAICTNDEEKRIVGWVGISEIDYENKTAHFCSEFIGDEKYRNGIPWIELQQFVLTYVFEELKFDKIFYTCITTHPTSMFMGPALFFDEPIIKKGIIEKNGLSFDQAVFYLRREVYEKHRDKGDYEFMSILSRYAKMKRKSK